MLLQFSVENFCSIKSKVLLSLEPSDDKEHQENICDKGINRALNMAVIYGANASGKSNLHKAITVAILLVRNSNTRQVGEALTGIVPFKLDKDSYKKPTTFEFIFIGEDSKKYIYGFSATVDQIIEEYLYKYDSCVEINEPSMVFERERDVFKFGEEEQQAMEAAQKMNTVNKLFLATATSWNVLCTAIPYAWFANRIDTYSSNSGIIPSIMNMYHNDMESNVSFAKKLLKSADINIDDLRIEEQKIDFRGAVPLPMVSQPVLGVPINNEQFIFKITTGHRVVDINNDERVYELSLVEESEGTRQIFYFAPILKDTFKKGKIIFVDELENSLHPFIARFLVNLFRSKEYNYNGAQLVFTTHETTLLSMDIFRNDQIYFTEKNNSTGVTDLYSLDEFPKVSNENVEKGYLLGRYGAIPFLKNEECAL